MSKPAHKQDDPAKAPGQVINEVALGDYIHRKNYHDAFDKVAEEMGLKKKKMTWGQWYFEYCKEHPELLQNSNAVNIVLALQHCWKVAQENV